MNNKSSKYIVSGLLLIALLVFGSCTHPSQSQTLEGILQNFYSCSTVDWALIDTLYYRPYNCDWPDEIGAQIHPDFPPEYSARYWHRLQNAKTYLHPADFASAVRSFRRIYQSTESHRISAGQRICPYRQPGILHAYLSGLLRRNHTG